MKTWTVYEHITPSGKRYIGITHLKPERRWRNGEGYNQKGQQCFYNAIEKYKWENIQHIIVSTDLTEKEAKWLENYLICYYRTFVGFSDCNGYNCTIGGDGVVGRTPWNKGLPRDNETKRKISESKKGKNPWNIGKTTPEEIREKISASHIGKLCPTKGMHRVYHEDGTFHMER